MFCVEKDKNPEEKEIDLNPYRIDIICKGANERGVWGILVSPNMTILALKKVIGESYLGCAYYKLTLTRGVLEKIDDKFKIHEEIIMNLHKYTLKEMKITKGTLILVDEQENRKKDIWMDKEEKVIVETHQLDEIIELPSEVYPEDPEDQQTREYKEYHKESRFNEIINQREERSKALKERRRSTQWTVPHK